MLKTIREGALDNPWFFRLLMLGIAMVFAVSMGWWGFGNTRQENIIAKVGEDHITIEEYQRVYKRTARFYRELFQDEYDDQKIRRQVVDGLVDNMLWLQEAKVMGVIVSDMALNKSVTTMAGFQKDGSFDPEVYQRILAREQFTPKSFETSQREALMVEKVKTFVKDGIALTPLEIKGVQAADPTMQDVERLIEERLLRKQQRAVMAYTLSLKEKTPVHIKEDHL